MGQELDLVDQGEHSRNPPLAPIPSLARNLHNHGKLLSALFPS